MSLPNHISPPLSSSSSKQSIRGTLGSTAPSRPRPIIDRSPSAQQVNSSIPAEQQSHEATAAEATASTHYEDGTHHENFQSTSQQPQFQPFFTLIEDATSSEYYHPTVHYIFSDDDTDIVTEAALRSLDMGKDGSPNAAKDSSRSTRDQQQHEGEGEDDTYGENGELSGSRKESLLPPPIPGVRDNYIILDVEPTHSDAQDHADTDPSHAAGAGGSKSMSTSPAAPTLQQHQPTPIQPSPQFTVTSSHSLTPAWQVLNTQVVPAPTFENNASGEQPSNGGLMLKIHGTAGSPPNILGKDKDKENGSQRLEDMMDQFAKRMSELRQIIEAGEEGHLSEGEQYGEPPVPEQANASNEEQAGIQEAGQDHLEGVGQNGSAGDDGQSHTDQAEF